MTKTSTFASTSHSAEQADFKAKRVKKNITGSARKARSDSTKFTGKEKKTAKIAHLTVEVKV